MTKTEQVYGGSLYELAREEGLNDVILQELGQVIAVFDANPDYWRFLSTLSISKQERCEALDQALEGKIQTYLLNFLKILCENGTIGQLKGCAKEYRRRYNEDNGIVEVCAVTAVPMSDALRDRLKNKMQAVTGRQVVLETSVDPEIIGGIVVKVNNEQFDTSLRTRLSEIAARLTNTIA